MSSAPANILEADSTVAHRYRITGYLGNRGFGQVYEADDSAMDQRVVLMRLHREFSDPEIRENFFETRATAAVEDPRIVDITDYGEDLDGRLFLVMPWIEEARSLESLVTSGRSLGWPRIKAIVREIAEALRAAHDKGVLHGGLDLSRVQLDKDDHVHVLDFGLAPALTRPGARATTNTSKLPGNPHYLAPEQIRGEGSNTRSDIYALGVMLWELISGAPPFVGDPLTVTRAHLERPLPELSRRGAPAEIEPLLHLALTKDASERIETMDEFLVLLDAMPAGAPASRPAPAPTPVVSPAPAASPAPVASPPPPVASPPPPKPVALEVVEPPISEPEPVAVPVLAEPAASEVPAPAAAQSGSALRLQPSPEPEPEPEPVAAPLPKPKRGLGKLELAILIFLGFDLLIVAAWLLFGRSDEPELARDEAAERAPAEAASEELPPSPTDEAPPASAAPVDEEPELELENEAAPAKSANEAIAELMPEPESAGPKRELAASLDDSDFREVMVASRDKILDVCLETRMRRTLKVSLKVDPSGKVSFARVVGGLSETQLGRCVVKQTYRMQFPATESGGTHVYTLRLR